MEPPVDSAPDLTGEILDATADGLLIVDEQGAVLRANRRFAELWRIPDDVFASGDDDQLLDFVLEQLVDPVGFRRRVAELYRSDEEHLDVIHFKDGRVFQRFSAPLLRDGEVRGRVWSFRDETARHAAESALRESESRYRTIYNDTPIMLHSVDERGVVVEVSDYWLERMGYRRDEVLGHPFADFLTEPSGRRAREIDLPRLMRRGWVSELPYDLVTKGGEQFPALLSGVVQRDDAGAFRRASAYILDVTEVRRADLERRRLENQLRLAQKLESLGLLAGGIAHDFNNLLAAIVGNADLLRLTGDLDEEGTELADEIIAASRRAADLCNQLLAYAGKGRFVVRPVDLAELVQDMGELLEVSKSKRVRLEYDFQPDLPTVRVDVTQLRQVVMNLITNASDAIGDGPGTITVRIHPVSHEESFTTDFGPDRLPPGSYLCLEVTDTGEGMGPATISRIFDPFFTSKQTGRGLGLAATLGIVRGHGGGIDVRSRTGEGTTFRICLPTSLESAEPLSAPSIPVVRPGAGRRVLVVDDQETVRTVARRVLESGGYAVVVADSGERAIELVEAEQGSFDVVLLDLTMVGIDGTDTMRELRRVDPRARIVLSSGFQSEDSEARAGSGDVPDAFLQKPYRAELLLHTIRSVMGDEP